MLVAMKKSLSHVSFDPERLAVQYYFGDLSYWHLPAISAEALQHNFDGPALRRLAGLINPVARDIRLQEIDSAFREMGVKAPIPKEEARLALATEAVTRAMSGESNIFNEATHIRVHLCEWHKAPPALRTIVAVSQEAEHAPPGKWEKLEHDLRAAMSVFLGTRR
jgi:hypothetical protein